MKPRSLAEAVKRAELSPMWDPASDPFDNMSDQEPSPASKGILVRVNKTTRADLKRLAIDLDTSMQGLLVQAINDILVRHGRKPTA